MLDKYDDNYGYLVTYHSSNIDFKMNQDSLMCYGYDNSKYTWLDPNDFNALIHRVNKKDLFNRVYEIGKKLAYGNKDIRFIGFENNSKNLFNISSKDILNNKLIIEEIEQFVLEYGFPESNGIPRINDEFTNLNIEDNNNGIFDNDIDPFQRDKIHLNPLLNQILPEEVIKRYSITYQMDVISFINLCLMIYYIKRFKYGLDNGALSTIISLSSVFTDLKDKFDIDKNNPYTPDKRNSVISYLLYMQHNLNCYINKYFSNNNFERIVFPDFNEIANSDDIYYTGDIVSFFRVKQYIIRTPILAAYDYLIQILPKRSNKSYKCKNCGSELHFKDVLCHTCKNNLYNEMLQKYKEKGNKEKYLIYKKEMDNYKKK